MWSEEEFSAGFMAAGPGTSQWKKRAQTYWPCVRTGISFHLEGQ